MIYNFEKYKSEEDERLETVQQVEELLERVKTGRKKAIEELAEMVERGITLNDSHVREVRKKYSVEEDPGTDAGYILSAYSIRVDRELDKSENEKPELKLYSPPPKPRSIFNKFFKYFFN